MIVAGSGKPALTLGAMLVSTHITISTRLWTSARNCVQIKPKLVRNEKYYQHLAYMPISVYHLYVTDPTFSSCQEQGSLWLGELLWLCSGHHPLLPSLLATGAGSKEGALLCTGGIQAWEVQGWVIKGKGFVAKRKALNPAWCYISLLLFAKHVRTDKSTDASNINTEELFVL